VANAEGVLGMMTNHERWMTELVERARAAATEGEAPIAAMIVQRERVVNIGRNTKASEQCGFAHAELNALLGAKVRLGRRPEGAVLYSTLEPCAMCLGAVIFAGIDTVVYGASDPKGGAVGMFQRDPVYRDWMPEIVAGVLEKECEGLKELPTFATAGDDGLTTDSADGSQRLKGRWRGEHAAREGFQNRPG